MIKSRLCAFQAATQWFASFQASSFVTAVSPVRGSSLWGLRVRGLTPPANLAPPTFHSYRPLHRYSVNSTPLFSSLCKIFRTNDVNSLNTSTIIVFDNLYNSCYHGS